MQYSSSMTGQIYTSNIKHISRCTIEIPNRPSRMSPDSKLEKGQEEIEEEAEKSPLSSTSSESFSTAARESSQETEITTPSDCNDTRQSNDYFGQFELKPLMMHPNESQIFSTSGADFDRHVFSDSLLKKATKSSGSRFFKKAFKSCRSILEKKQKESGKLYTLFEDSTMSQSLTFAPTKSVKTSRPLSDLTLYQM